MTIAFGKDSLGIDKKFTKEDLLKVILEFLKTWVDYFNGSLRNLLANFSLKNDSVAKIVLAFIGEGTKLNGLKEYILKVLPTNPVEFISIPTICCREAEYINCLGAIFMASSYRGTLEDENKQQVRQINRVDDSLNSARSTPKKDRYDELKDEL